MTWPLSSLFAPGRGGMRLLERVHEGFVYPRRVARLSEELAGVIPQDVSVLDVGSGDGAVAAALLGRRGDLRVEGVDVFLRPQSAIPTIAFDGERLPHGDTSVDIVLFVDSIHHMKAPLTLLREARRVASSAVVIKDHLLEGPLAAPTLRLMDRVGNERHGVALKHEYWPRSRWLATFDELGLVPAVWTESLRLYPWWARLVFDRSLHFLTRLEPR